MRVHFSLTAVCLIDFKIVNNLTQGRPTGGPLEGFEWPAYFLRPSVLSNLAEIEDRFDAKTPFCF